MRRERIHTWELKGRKEIDEAFAEVFHLSMCNFGLFNAYEQVEQFLFDRHVRKIILTRSRWDYYSAEVTNEHDRTNYTTWKTVTVGAKGHGGSENKTLALMLAAIDWQERKREKTNQKVRERRARAKAREQAA